jgi:hypothetical protein
MREEMQFPFSKADIEENLKEIKAAMISGEQIPPEKVELLKLLQQVGDLSVNLDPSLEKNIYQAIIEDFTCHKSLDLRSKDDYMKFFCDRFISRASELGIGSAEKCDLSEVEVPVVGYMPVLDYVGVAVEVERIYNTSLWSKQYNLPEDEWLLVREQIVSKAVGEIDLRKPHTEEEGKEIVKRVADSELMQYVSATEPPKVAVEETKKEEPIARNYLNKKTVERAAIGGLGALLLAGSIWLATRGPGLEKKVTETEITAVEKPSETPYVEKTIVPENITAQNPVNETLEDYNEDVLPVPAEVKPEPAMPAVQADQPMNQEIPLPETYVPANAVPKEMHKEISKETFEAMYVLAKTKIKEKISNYAELWNQFFQHTQTPVQIIPAMPAQISKQVQKDNFVYVHKPSRENTARNKSKAYVSANVGVIMPIRSDIYRQGAITAGLSAGVTNERDTELNIGAEIFKTSANGNEKGTDWSAESKNFLVRVGARRNFPKQGTYVETDLEGLFSKSRFIVGYEYNVNEPNSSVTAGFGVGAGINTRNAEFGVRYIHFFNPGEVGHAVAVRAGCKF